ncbi:beta-N-acetylhexosaminidase [Pedobacter sp. JY14-1]|uniref:beta-N-acetylhexosaminidase n=1 Tax=Pedobacter sp. JY14-1 TaxID=3034151 RepID=UPI0023E13AED|nr:beta-N-acetylhexosaminidase [Pedobacter sp. JY14-1]
MKFSAILLLLALSLSVPCRSQSLPQPAAVAIIPQPVELKLKNGLNFQLSNNTLILISDPELTKSADFLADYLLRYYHIHIGIARYTHNENRKNAIRFLRTASVAPHHDQYRLSVTSDVVELTASSDKGIFYGMQTMLQLLTLPGNGQIRPEIPCAEVLDYPRFDYRGMHLDVSRHFFGTTFIKRYIDYLAFHKLNYFHWHLTDDHGWRIEIKKYPELTRIGAWRKGTIIGLYPGVGNDGKRYGGYYTQDEIKDIINYASDRYITVIPEIEMPGHSLSVLAAYPDLGTEPDKKYEVAQTWGIFNKFNNVLQPTEKTFRFLENVLTEVMDLFPSPYIHIGGDECSRIWWKRSPVSQQIIREKGLKDENDLQNYMINRIGKFVNSKGKTIIGWDEILEGSLQADAVVMSWRGEKGGIYGVKTKHRVIMTPENFLYFNHAQSVKEDSLTAAKYLPLSSVYNYDPVPNSLSPAEAGYIWGAQANLWTEYISNPSKAEYMLFPRLDALSELLWSPGKKRNYDDFLRRLRVQMKRYDAWGVNYNSSLGPGQKNESKALVGH